MASPPDLSRSSLIDALRRQVERLESARPLADEQIVSTGSPALDRLLPEGGLRKGWLVEYLSPGPGGGAGALALAAARETCRQGRALVVIDRERAFYPPAVAAWGLDLSLLLVLQPAQEAEALWAADQALRCPGVGAVWASWNKLEGRDFRRLQLAAEIGGTLGLFLRLNRVRGRPTWAHVQFAICQRKKEPGETPGRGGACWRICVELVRCQGGTGGQTVELELDETTGIWQERRDDATNPLHLSAELARSTPARRA